MADLPSQQLLDETSADVLTESAAAPRPATAHQQQSPASTSGRSAAAPSKQQASGSGSRGPSAMEVAGARVLDAAAAALPEPPLIAASGVRVLPEQDYGNLRGGQYPFQYDPVYGLPVVREVVRYADLLRDIRQGEVSLLRRLLGGDCDMVVR